MMKIRPALAFGFFFFLFLAGDWCPTQTASRGAYAQLIRRIVGREDTILTDASRCLHEIMEIPAKSIPATLFEKAEGIAVFPGLVKGSFILGAQHGSGVLIVKNAEGVWEAPRFLEMTGGSVGFQAGIQSADVILIFCTRKSVDAAMKDQFTIGADASVAAGPIGRQALASTNAQLSSEIYSYSRSRGLFLGVALDGCVLNLDESATDAYYKNGVPPSATSFIRLTESYANQKPPTDAGVSGNQPANASENLVAGNVPEDAAVSDREATRLLFVTAHAELMKILDPEWQRWLALPPDAQQPTAGDAQVFTPSSELLTLQSRLQKIADDPKYTALATRSEFIQVRLLLNLYLENCD